MSVEDDLEAVRQRLQRSILVSNSDLLDRLNNDQTQQQQEIEALPTSNHDDGVAHKLAEIRHRLNVADSISDERLIELIANNEFIPEQPKDRRDRFEVFQDWLNSIYQRYANSRTISALIVIGLITGWAIAWQSPSVQQRRKSYDAGWNACRERIQVGMSCDER